MKHFCMLIIVFSVFMRAAAQIDLSDSTFQVIGYWNKGEKQTYNITIENFKVEASDTTGRETLKYSVDVTIADSTAKSYTIDWYYHDFSIQTDNEITRKLFSLNENNTIRFHTNELGTFTGIENWKEIKETISKNLTILRQDMSDIPQFNKLIGQYEAMYSTKASIEASVIKDIQQFYTYHGGRYKLGEEIKSSLKLPNLYDMEKPFDTEVTLSLDEINSEDNNAIIRMKQVVDSGQLTKTTFDFLVRSSVITGTDAPSWEDFPPLKNETWVASRIHGSGWIIYSVETREVSAEGVTKVQNRIIEIE